MTLLLTHTQLLVFEGCRLLLTRSDTEEATEDGLPTVDSVALPCLPPAHVWLLSSQCPGMGLLVAYEGYEILNVSGVQRFSESRISSEALEFLQILSEV